MNEDCKACLSAVGELKGDMGEFKGQLTILNTSVMKIFYALIALAGASIGTKFIGTPWYIEIAMYTALSSAIFVLLVSINKWECLGFWERWIRISFVVTIIYAFCLRVYHYHTGTPFTAFEGMFKNGMDTLLAIGFLMLAWQRDANRRPKKRRHGDL